MLHTAPFGSEDGRGKTEVFTLRIVHMSDTHLGFRQYGLPERERDFLRAFIETCKRIATVIKPDLVIHSGDLFNSSNPSVRTIIMASKVCRKLRKSKCPFVVLPGTHDIPRTGILQECPTSILRYAAGVVDLGMYESRNFTTTLEVAGKTVGIVGIPDLYGYTQKKGLLETAKPIGDVSLLMFHGGLKEVFSGFEFSIGDLPVGFDYYAGGHIHSHLELVHPNSNGARVVYPGSTEYTDFGEVGRDKGFYIVELDKSGVDVEFVKLERTRKFVDLPPIDCTNKNPEDVVTEMVQVVGKGTSPGSVVRLNLVGELPIGKLVAIDFFQIVKFARQDMGALHIELSNQVVVSQAGGVPVQGQIRISSPESEVEEYVRGLKGYSEEQKNLYLKLAVKFLRQAAGLGNQGYMEDAESDRKADEKGLEESISLDS